MPCTYLLLVTVYTQIIYVFFSNSTHTQVSISGLARTSFHLFCSLAEQESPSDTLGAKEALNDLANAGDLSPDETAADAWVTTPYISQPQHMLSVQFLRLYLAVD